MSLLKSDHVVNDTVKQDKQVVSEKVDAVSQDVAKQEKPKASEKTIVDALKAELKSKAKAEVKEKPMKPEAETKKDQVKLEVVDDHKLAVKHTIALVKAQKLHQDLLQFHKLLINNKDGSTSQKAPESDKQEVKVADAKTTDAQTVQPKESIKEGTEAKSIAEPKKEETAPEPKTEESDDQKK